MNPTRLILHQFNPEGIHDLAVKLGYLVGKSQFQKILEQIYCFHTPQLEVRLGNLTFPNPVGLAAGFDKDGVLVPVLQALGFGFIEVGTVTPEPQPGNPKPRLFRLKAEEAIINRMGFNNRGIEALVKSLQTVKKKVPVGVNLGKNKTTAVEKAANDYIIGLQKAWPVADYFTINISSPNTENLRDLQGREFLEPLIDKILQERDKQSEISGKYKQVWLKIAPDLTDPELYSICETVMNSGIDALIVSNTTIERFRLNSKWATQAGGLSGKPLFDLSNNVLKKVQHLTKGKLPLIGVGGIYSARDIRRKFSLGASLIQIYTSFVFEGPGLVKKLKKELVS